MMEAIVRRNIPTLKVHTHFDFALGYDSRALSKVAEISTAPSSLRSASYFLLALEMKFIPKQIDKAKHNMLPLRIRETIQLAKFIFVKVFGNELIVKTKPIAAEATVMICLTASSSVLMIVSKRML